MHEELGVGLRGKMWWLTVSCAVSDRSMWPVPGGGAIQDEPAKLTSTAAPCTRPHL